jgi:hypothetical protein
LFAGVLVDGVVALAEDDRQARRLRMLLLDASGGADVALRGWLGRALSCGRRRFRH